MLMLMKLNFTLKGVLKMSADWRRSSWEVEFAPIDKLIDKMKEIPEQSEKILNKVLHTKSTNDVVRSIITGIPISEVKNRLMNKRHAKSSNPLKTETENLGFKVRPKKSFEYLKYPDLGIGKSRNNVPEEFMRKGMENEVERISDDLMIALMQEIEKKVGGK